LQRLELPVTGKRQELAKRLAAAADRRGGSDRPVLGTALGPVFSSDKFANVFVVGDLHGDLSVYLRFLLATGSCQNEREIVQLLNEITSWEFSDEIALGGFRATIPGKLAGITWKKGCKNLLIFNGDILDNRRPGFVSPALDDTYPMHHLVGLRQDAVRHGGGVVHIIGNHELSNLWNTLRCTDFTPPVHCQQDKFTDARKRLVRKFINDMGSRVAVAVDRSLICHGGISPTFIGRIGTTDLNQINKLYTDAVDGKGQHSWFNLEDDLTWYRPFGVDDREKIKKTRAALASLTVDGSCLGLTSNVVAHTIMEDTAPNKKLRNGYLYPCDFGMSSVFHEQYVESISYLSITENTVAYHTYPGTRRVPH
jgi:hypothetical protein